MKTLRLLITKACHRNCEWCCNKDYDLEKLQIEYDFRNYNEIIFTGGEPLLGHCNEIIITLSSYIKFINPECKIYIYTALPQGIMIGLNQFKHIDGYTLTLHDNSKNDITYFKALNDKIIYNKNKYNKLNFRLNVFKGVNISENIDLSNWIIKDNIEWIKDCPLPENEVFKRINNI